MHIKCFGWSGHRTHRMRCQFCLESFRFFFRLHSGRWTERASTAHPPTMQFSANIDFLFSRQKMSECRVVPCYKLFLKELKEIVATNPVNISLSSSICGSGISTTDTSPEVDIEHITIKHHHHYPVSSTVVEAVNRGVQTNLRPETRSHSASLSGGSRDMSALLNPKLFNRQVVSVWRNGEHTTVRLNAYFCIFCLFAVYIRL